LCQTSESLASTYGHCVALLGLPCARRIRRGDDNVLV